MEAVLDGRWHKADVFALLPGKETYSVQHDGHQWKASGAYIRDTTIDLSNVDAIQAAPPKMLVRALQTSAAVQKKKMEKKIANQLQCYKTCRPPVRYVYSHHYSRRMVGDSWETYNAGRQENNLICLESDLVFVAEQEFFGEIMLGTFSKQHWGLPQVEEVNAEEIKAVREKFMTTCSFGRSCIVFDTAKMAKQVTA